jgi:hypothetical protein
MTLRDNIEITPEISLAKYAFTCIVPLHRSKACYLFDLIPVQAPKKLTVFQAIQNLSVIHSIAPTTYASLSEYGHREKKSIEKAGPRPRIRRTSPSLRPSYFYPAGFALVDSAPIMNKSFALRPPA